MAEAQNPKLRFVYRIQAYLPLEWKEKIRNYMKQKGYISESDLVRDLIREKVIEGGQ
jgi:spore coat protein CotF